MPTARCVRRNLQPPLSAYLQRRCLLQHERCDGGSIGRCSGCAIKLEYASTIIIIEEAGLCTIWSNEIGLEQNLGLGKSGKGSQSKPKTGGQTSPALAAGRRMKTCVNKNSQQTAPCVLHKHRASSLGLAAADGTGLNTNISVARHTFGLFSRLPTESRYRGCTPQEE